MTVQKPELKNIELDQSNFKIEMIHVGGHIHALGR